MPNERTEVRISGLGGQGVVLAGKVLGTAAVYDGKYAVHTQSYGAEARGSAARSEVIVSDTEVFFPQVRECDVLVAMSQEALDKYLMNVKPGGILLVDPETVREVPDSDVSIFEIPATQIAEGKLGSKTYANIVMLGALIKTTGMIGEEAVEKAVTDSVPGETIEKNLEAFKFGFSLSPGRLDR